MRYFKVQYGFGADDYFSVDENEAKKAIRAQVTGAICVLNEGTINGERIITIRPDYNRLMGFNRDYHLTGEDYGYIGRKTVHDHELFLTDTKLELSGQKPLERKEISDGVKRVAEKMNEPVHNR